MLTVFLWWLCAQLLPGGGWTGASEANRATTLRWVAWIAVFAIGIVLSGLGFAINRRSLSAKWGDRSLDWEGGDDGPDPVTAARRVEGAARQERREIEQESGSQKLDDPEGGA
jgi:hypothetical protein